MYSAHDGIHMPPVMTFIVGVMSSTECVWWHIQEMWRQIEWVSRQIYSLWFHRHSVCDIIYSGYDVINIVGAMTYRKWYDVIKRGYDVINSAYGVLYAVCVISYIHRVWYHQSSGCDYADTVSVMSDTMVVLSLSYTMWDFIYTEYDALTQEVSCPRYSGCDVTSIEDVMSYRVCVLSWIEWLWHHEYRIFMS